MLHSDAVDLGLLYLLRPAGPINLGEYGILDKALDKRSIR